MVERGICVYTRDRNASLHGVYTNEVGRTAGMVFTEMAKLETPDPSSGHPLNGTYSTSWYEERERLDGTIVISSQVGVNVFEVRWRIDGQNTDAYVGTGYELDGKFIVSYKSL